MKYYFYPDKITLVLSILCLMAICWMIYYVIHANKWYSAIPTLLTILLFLFFAIKVPYCVYIRENFIEIKQLVGSKKITDIKKIEKLSKKEFSSSIRTFGNGGFLGYTGRFYSSKLGTHQVLALNLNELVKVTTKSGKIYVINYPYELLE